MAGASRPLSPHLQVYRWYFTMALSITHRITGGALTVGLIFFSWWLLALATGPDSFATVQAVMGSFLGILVLLGFTLALWYHLLNGIRHLVWDGGYMIDKVSAHQTGVWLVIGTITLTILTWIVILVAA